MGDSCATDCNSENVTTEFNKETLLWEGSENNMHSINVKESRQKKTSKAW